MSVTGLVLPDMVEPDAEIEALAAARNFVVHRGFSQTLVELVAERKVHVRPTSASIAAEAELVLPGAGCQARAPRPAEQPTHEVHIHVRPSGPTDLQEAAD